MSIDSIDGALLKRGDSKCELCKSDEDLSAYDIPPITQRSLDKSILVCSSCLHQIEETEEMDPNHWRCLNDSMWSEIAAVQVMSWRILNRLNGLGLGWPDELLEMLYIEDDVKKWAMANMRPVDEPTVDINGVPFTVGCSAVMTKDMYITGANFTAKRGAVVKNIGLTNKSTSIDGNLNGFRIVLGTGYLKII
ncbi:MAG: PhnA domain-containing protein [Cocleimonas sp.]|nr:PhnA domain-containing protein [Cocleimonas sp.]